MSDMERSDTTVQSAVPAASAPRPPTAMSPSSRSRSVTSVDVASARSWARVALTRTGPLLMYQFNRMGRTGMAGAAMLLFALTFVLSAVMPQQRQLAELDQQIRQAHHLSTTAETAPVRLNRFMNTLPKRSELPKILSQVFILAGTAGVALEHGRYELSPTRAGHLAQYRMTFPIKAHYPQIRQFIDSVLTTVPSAALEGMRIERKGVGEDTVAADLRFSIFVRNDT